MKPWVLALGVSLALHLAIAVAFRSEALAPEPRPVAKRGDGFVSFTTVSVAEPPKAVAPAPARAFKANVAVPSLAVAVEALSDSPVAVENGAPAVEPGPKPGVGAPAAPGPEQPRGGSGPVDPSAEVIALVHARLAAAAERCYPAAARRFRQRGTVQLSFCTDDRGGTSSTSVTQSSGAELLDAAARGCVLENAAPFPPEASTRCFSVPVRFGLGP